jgi:hypothetical protein
MAPLALLRIGFFALIATGIAAPAQGQSTTKQTAKFIPRSNSASRQFVVFANDSLLRGALCNYADEVRHGTASLMGWQQGWRYPISIAVRDAEAAIREKTTSKLRLLTMPPEIVFQIDVHLGRDFNPDRIRSEIVAALIMERAAARSASPVTQSFELPAWLVEGACGLLDLRTAYNSVPGFAALLETNQIPDLRDFLKLDPVSLDTPSANLYRGLSSCLLKLLIDLPNGSRSLDSYLSSIPGGKVNSFRALLAFFPALGGTDPAAQKWWKLGVATLATRGRSPFLSPTESSEKLEKLLVINIPSDKKQKKPKKNAKSDKDEPPPAEPVSSEYALSDYAKFIKNKNRKPPLEAKIAEVNALAARCHPVLQPVVSAYTEILTRIIEGESKGLDVEIEKLTALRQIAIKRCGEINDYMNWYEATSIDVRSGVFDSYFRAIKELEKNDQDNSTPITVYLDRIEAEVR